MGDEAESAAFLRTEYLRTATGFTLPLEAGLNGTIQLRWRIEIKKYPKLTEIGSIRKATLIGHMGDRPRKYDNTPYGGFYTQDQIREIVAFAAARLISVVPEIDMSGHMAAAITAYPELGNTGAQLGTRTIWGISSSVLNIEDSTVDFIKDVLDEVMDLFPGRFIHIGGDKSPKQEWSESHRAQERMVELGLKSEDELQSWFIPKRNERSELVHSRMSEGKAWFHTPRLCRGTGSRLSDSGSRALPWGMIPFIKQMDNHISLKGRRLIGWSEILEGGIAPGAAVMSWLGEDGWIEAANQGYDVVMAPGSSTYFDHCQAEP
ncbi:MAG: family 20 glycosylhydrolase, partial [Spirochaetaceae bacterium]|nr:family 20 glycosylhydrolase [Spirochaetaceae bacterium]